MFTDLLVGVHSRPKCENS